MVLVPQSATPFRCLVGEQRRSGRHHATAKLQWGKVINIAVMECYYLSKPVDENNKLVRGYRRRMHSMWKEKELFTCNEQRLCDQARAIRKNECLTLVELEAIKRRVCGEQEDESERVVIKYR